MSKIKYFSFYSEGRGIVLFVDDISRFIFDNDYNTLYVKTKSDNEAIPIFLKKEQKSLGVSNIVDRILYFLSMEFERDDMEDERSDQLDLDMVIDSILVDMDSDVLDDGCELVKVKDFMFKDLEGNNHIIPVEDIDNFVTDFGCNKLYLVLKNTGVIMPIFIEEKNRGIKVESIVDKIKYYLNFEFNKKENPKQVLSIDFVIDGLIVDESFKEVSNG